MALAGTQKEFVHLRNRTVPKHVPQSQRKIPPLSKVNESVDDKIAELTNQTSSKSVDQQISFWCSNIATSIHVCFDIWEPEYNNQFCIMFMIRWFMIGASICKLTQIWKDNKEEITTHSSIADWLPFVVKKKLVSSNIPRGSYSMLRVYARLFEKREIVANIPRLTGKYTHKHNEMNSWLRYVPPGTVSQCL